MEKIAIHHFLMRIRITFQFNWMKREKKEQFCKKSLEIKIDSVQQSDEVLKMHNLSIFFIIEYPVNEFIWFFFSIFCFWFANFKISKWSNYKINLIDSIHANQLRLKICMVAQYLVFLLFFSFSLNYFESFNFSKKKKFTPHRTEKKP